MNPQRLVGLNETYIAKSQKIFIEKHMKKQWLDDYASINLRTYISLARYLVKSKISQTSNIE